LRLDIDYNIFYDFSTIGRISAIANAKEEALKGLKLVSRVKVQIVTYNYASVGYFCITDEYTEYYCRSFVATFLG
jgi:hypothetical protein